MALTKEDLKEIKKITDEAVDNLALITKRGFDEIEIVLSSHSAYFSQIERNFENLENRHQELFLQVQGIDDKLAFMGDDQKNFLKKLKLLTVV